MSTSTRDYAFEALAEVTGTDWTAGRGELNAALKSIREQSEIDDGYVLADVIHERAKMYRQVMGENVLLTAPALAKHWKRVLEESSRAPKVQHTNQSAAITSCSSCNGDRFVLVARRKPVATAWMNDHGLKASEEMIEEYAPCPDCGAQEVEWYAGERTRRCPDPARVREMMRS